MEKINFEAGLREGFSELEIIKNFFSQIFIDNNKKDDEFSKRSIQYRLDRIIFKVRSIDPRGKNIYVYAVCSKDEINKLISFDKDYVSFVKEVKEVDGLREHGKMKFNTYKITYNENLYRKTITFIIVQNNMQGEKQFIDVLVAEDDLYYAKERLDHYDAIF